MFGYYRRDIELESLIDVLFSSDNVSAVVNYSAVGILHRSLKQQHFPEIQTIQLNQSIAIKKSLEYFRSHKVTNYGTKVLLQLFDSS